VAIVKIVRYNPFLGDEQEIDFSRRETMAEKTDQEKREEFAKEVLPDKFVEHVKEDKKDEAKGIEDLENETFKLPGEGPAPTPSPQVPGLSSIPGGGIITEIKHEEQK
jgi:hypothetical protein